MISASAPCKLILCGEHFVVYGAPAIAIPVGPRCDLKLKVSPSGPEGPQIAMDSGEFRGAFSADGRQLEDSPPRLYYAACKEALKIAKQKWTDSFFADAHVDGVKGMGRSSSISAALSAAIFTNYGFEASERQLFQATFAGDNEAHGGRASGLDAAVITQGKPVIFQKKFGMKTEYSFKPAKLQLPEGTTLVVADTFTGARANTADLIAKFADANGITKKPEALNARERARVIAPFKKIWATWGKLLRPDADAKELGALFDENHELLAQRGVSTSDIELARQRAKKHGALGSKLTGAGGSGGAVLILCWKRDAEKIADALGMAGFKAFEAKLENRGPEAKKA